MLYYIYNGDELLGFVYNNNTYYYHKNIFGDIIGILDSNYNEIVSYEYDSWGALVNITDNSNINLGTINPFRYRSYYYDTETKLYYLNSRYYNPDIGRFINSDSTVSTGQGFEGNNMFVYCGNNSIKRIDDIGELWLTLALGTLAATALTIYGYNCGEAAMRAQIESNKFLGVDNIYTGVTGAWLGGAVGGITGVTGKLGANLGVVVGEIANMVLEGQSIEDTSRNMLIGSGFSIVYANQSLFGGNPIATYVDVYTSTYVTNVVNTTASRASNNKNAIVKTSKNQVAPKSNLIVNNNVYGPPKPVNYNNSPLIYNRNVKQPIPHSPLDNLILSPFDKRVCPVT